MNFDRTEEAQQLAASIARFVQRDYDFDRRRKIIGSPEGFSRDAWKTIAELGLTGLCLPVDHGGFGGGAVDAMPVMEAIGEALIVEPYVATVGLGAQLIARGGNEAQKDRILPAVAAGELTLAFAQTEADARYDLSHVAMVATRRDGGYVVEGEKRVVLHGEHADLLVTSARTSGMVGDDEGLSLFVVDRKTPGVAIHGYRTLDGMRAADVVFNEVRVGDDALVGDAGNALPLIEAVIDFATALICAEAVGAIRYANEATLEYLKTRQQFGVPIGSFQALQHRMVDLFIEYEQVQSMASLACAAVDTAADGEARKRVVSAAKIRVADACRRVSQESVQLHGGMGMTDELKVSHTFRRLTMIAQQFGDADHHLKRFAGGKTGGR
jgi:alkylation response protein AidB-like acyl-CoA dehydrogenase